MRTRRRIATGLLAAIGVGFLLPVLAPPEPAGASTPVTTEFTLCGPTFDTDYVVPPGIRFVTVVARGAGGRNGGDGTGTNTPTAPGGSGDGGARVSGTLAVSPGQVFTVHVGCSTGSSGLASGGAGGAGSGVTPGGPGGSGGGASGVSLGSSPRIIAAGGGGGAGGAALIGDALAGGSGGRGGRPTGVSGGDGENANSCTTPGGGGGGASQTSGGSGGARGLASSHCTPPQRHGQSGSSGSFLQGGSGGAAAPQVDFCGGSGGGGGGGGRYGGGGGGGGAEGCSSGGGGGGGSSWAASAFNGVSYGAGAPANSNGSVTITAWASVPTTLTLTPTSQTRTAGQTATVTARVLDQDGDPMSGVSVDFIREGANPGSGSATTNSLGNASHTWTGANGPQDVVTARVEGTTAVGTATVTWRIPAALTLSPATQTRTAGETATVTARVLDQLGDPLSGVTVDFERTGANPGSESVVTDASGDAVHSYTGVEEGEDAIEASVSGSPSAVGAASVTWVRDNQAPDAPTLVAPGDGSSHPFGEPHRFTVNATDPDDDPYTATVTVREAGTNCDGAVVETFTTDLAPSGMDSSGSPSAPLPVGDYCWSAHATDAHGADGPTSGLATFSVIPAGHSPGPSIVPIVPL